MTTGAQILSVSLNCVLPHQSDDYINIIFYKVFKNNINDYVNYFMKLSQFAEGRTTCQALHSAGLHRSARHGERTILL